MSWRFLLMVDELALSFFALRRTVTQHFETSLNAASLLGLVAQSAFALFSGNSIVGTAQSQPSAELK
jgi:hypothetical protein